MGHDKPGQNDLPPGLVQKKKKTKSYNQYIVTYVGLGGGGAESIVPLFLNSFSSHQMTVLQASFLKTISSMFVALARLHMASNDAT